MFFIVSLEKKCEQFTCICRFKDVVQVVVYMVNITIMHFIFSSNVLFWHRNTILESMNDLLPVVPEFKWKRWWIYFWNCAKVFFYWQGPYNECFHIYLRILLIYSYLYTGVFFFSGSALYVHVWTYSYVIQRQYTVFFISSFQSYLQIIHITPTCTFDFLCVWSELVVYHLGQSLYI